MAYTVSSIVDTVVGEFRLWNAKITADAATQAIQVPGAVSVDAILQWDQRSGSSMSCMNIGMNTTASGNAAKGYVSVSNAVAGNVYNLTVLYH